MSKQLSLKIKNVESRERKGAHGAWRLEFCRKYRTILPRIRVNTHAALLTSLRPDGVTVSCRTGCAHCCFHYVTASLAHGIVIVDHLYQRRDLLGRFLANYEKWQAEGGPIADDLDRIRSRAALSPGSVDVMTQTRPLAARYLEMDIRCPFLTEDRCDIYEVRPLSCSGHVSISPPDWCAPGSKRNPALYNLVPNDDDLIALARLGDPRLLLYEMTLPKMVHRLLTLGSTALAAELWQGCG